jgi:hypothetical protein
MASPKSLDVARRATELYDSQFREELESTHLNQYVAVEPDSGEYFLGETMSDAIQAARRRYPNRVSFAIRIGHPSAVHLGVMST